MYVCTVAVLCLFLHHAFHSMEVLSAACSTWSHGIGARGHVTFFLSPLVCIYSHHCACPLVWGCGWQLVFWIPHTRHLAPFCMWQKQRRIECLLGVREICFETILFFLSCICVVVTCTIKCDVMQRDWPCHCKFDAHCFHKKEHCVPPNDRCFRVPHPYSTLHSKPGYLVYSSGCPVPHPCPRICGWRNIS